MTLAAGLAGLLVAAPAPAQPAPVAPAPEGRATGLAAWAGRWRLDLRASDFGKSGRVPRSREEWIRDEYPWVAVRSLSVRSGEDTLLLEYRYHTDGEALNHVRGQEIRTRGRRDGGTLRFASLATFLLLRFEVDEHWSLSADGGTLTQERVSRSPIGEDRQRLVYRRAP